MFDRNSSIRDARSVQARRRGRRALRLVAERLEERTLLATITVTSGDDSGAGSLREAILAANATPGADLIAFDIGGGGHQVITLASPLPVVTDTATIDGTTQPGYAGAPLVEIDGNHLATDGLLHLAADGSAVKSLVVNNVDGVAIWPQCANFVIQGCYIGTDATGTMARPALIGIEVYQGSGLIGGSGQGEGNLVSGNEVGIQIDDTSPVVIAGNRIGTTADGMAGAVPNTTGIYGFAAAGTATVGGAATGAGNLISGNTFGIRGERLVVQGNRIGTNAQGTAAIANFVGVSANHSLIGGTEPGARNLISGNTGDGLRCEFSVVQGNFIGTDATGSMALVPGTNSTGIFADHSTIGGTTPEARNVISGNGNGLYRGANLIQGNFIGTDVTGEAAVPNFFGIFEPTGATIGGTEPGAGNLISGNRTGIGFYATGSLIQGNRIGTNQDGTRAIRNDFGIGQPRENNTIGGTTPDAANVIAGNGVGIYIIGNGTPTPRPNTIQGNFVGTDPTGTVPLGNDWGVYVSDGASDVLVGGATTGAGNVIAFNYTGVVVGDSAGGGGRRNSILGNSIRDNEGLGVDLGRDGATPNGSHTGQAGGPNGWQHFPVLASAYAGPVTYVVGSLDSTPNSTFTIEFFANPAPHSTGYGEGRNYLGWAVVTTDPDGLATFQVAGLAGTTPGQYVSATATLTTLDAGGHPTYLDTSEFAANVVVTRAPTTTVVIPSITDPLFGVETVTFTATVGTIIPGLGTPTGSVQFAVDGIAIGVPVLLVGGVAGYTTADLTVGDRTITATYGGDPTFLPSDVAATVHVIPPSSLSGVVFEDFNNDGLVDFGEGFLADVPVHLTGIDDRGAAVDQWEATDSDGAYIFRHLRPGCYTITETQPVGYTQGKNEIGTGGGTVALDQFDVCLAAGLDALNYNYGERPASTGAVGQGQSAGIGFWNNKHGQALIKALNGGATSTQLGDWLAATFPNMFGAHAGPNNLHGLSNAGVAAFFQGRFVLKGEKLDAQVLATALAVYVTNPTLNPTGAGAEHGFVIAGDGLGTATFDVGVNGEAFGVANGTTMTVMDLLFAAEAQAVDGILYAGNAARRSKANKVFGAINQAGQI